MKKQSVFVVGPTDSLLNTMWSQHPDYRVTSEISLADIICFQGGADIHPSLYNEDPIPGVYFNKNRDTEDLSAWDKGYDKPKVGICRGGQFLNVMSEGSMWQNVSGHGTSHTMINLLNLGLIDQGAEIEVTSDHHQMMIPNLEYGEVLGIAYMANQFDSPDKDKKKPDYDTEVVFYNNTQSLCFQPHPEYEYKIMTRTYFFKLMEFFFR